MTSVSLFDWKNRSLPHQFVAQLSGVDQVAVVADRNLPMRAVNAESAGR